MTNNRLQIVGCFSESTVIEVICNWDKFFITSVPFLHFQFWWGDLSNLRETYETMASEFVLSNSVIYYPWLSSWTDQGFEKGLRLLENTRVKLVMNMWILQRKERQSCVQLIANGKKNKNTVQVCFSISNCKYKPSEACFLADFNERTKWKIFLSRNCNY